MHNKLRISVFRCRAGGQYQWLIAWNNKVTVHLLVHFPAMRTLSGGTSTDNHYCKTFTWLLCVHILQLFCSYFLFLGPKGNDACVFKATALCLSKSLGSNTWVIRSGIILTSALQLWVHVASRKWKKHAAFNYFMTEDVWWLYKCSLER